jgi:hypothetical protein
MSNEALILDLLSELAPVRRRSMVREGLLLLALCAAELALAPATGLMRADMHHMGWAPHLMWRVVSLGFLALATCVLAVRSFSPTARPRQGLMLACVFAVLAIVGGAFVTPAGMAELGLLARIDPISGVRCATSIFVLSLPILALLGALMRRAAPTQPRLSALASGIAAGTCAAFVFAFCCPFNDPLYVVVWYSVGCIAVAAVARWCLPQRFRL